ncbi:hypothetical protein BaRGS_00006255 [Batillaria attramentaria]|uniref:Uncharacterized protein n=1 Tax=Batillaria attramentaria TaxID=370345 RepID=A0ABD0LTP2_9CAEN
MKCVRLYNVIAHCFVWRYAGRYTSYKTEKTQTKLNNSTLYKRRFASMKWGCPAGSNCHFGRSCFLQDVTLNTFPILRHRQIPTISEKSLAAATLIFHVSRPRFVLYLFPFSFPPCIYPSPAQLSVVRDDPHNLVCPASHPRVSPVHNSIGVQFTWQENAHTKTFRDTHHLLSAASHRQKWVMGSWITPPVTEWPKIAQRKTPFTEKLSTKTPM